MSGLALVGAGLPPEKPRAPQRSDKAVSGGVEEAHFGHDEQLTRIQLNKKA